MISYQIGELLLSIWIGIILLIGVKIRERANERILIEWIYKTTLIVLVYIGYKVILTIQEDIIMDIYNGMIRLISLIQCIKVVSISLVIMVLILSIDYLKKQHMYTIEYLSLILFVLLGILFLISAEDLMLIYMVLELQGLSLYILAGYNVTSVKSTEAGLKYFVVGSIASIMYLLGVAIIYCELGSVDLGILKVLMFSGLEQLNIKIGVMLLLSGIMFKLAVAPFHVWIADVYEGVLITVTAFYAIVPKIVLVMILIKFLYVFGGEWLMLWLAVLSMAIGTLSALYQTSIKRLVAYSAIAHMGFVLLGLVSGSVLAMGYVIIYMIIYALVSVNLFAILIGMGVETIRELGGMIRNNVILMIVGVFNFFSLVGVPPLAGFYGKAMILSGAMEANMNNIAVIFVIFSAVSAFYYLRLVKIVVYEEGENLMFYNKIERKVALLIASTFMVNIIFILVFNDLLNMIIELM
jgi:NADH-quinone oxidoreductase subunit N